MMKLEKNTPGVLLWTAALIAGLVRFGAAAPAAASAAKTEVAVSSAAEASTVESLYAAGKLRDPFLKPGSVSAPKAVEAVPEEFSIHNLSLRAIMKDAAADYALFQDMNTPGTYILRKGRLYGPKDKAVSGVVGTINLKQKSATLMTPDKDVQVFRLGEDEKEKEKDKNP